jgi:hypothetical protein
MPLLEKIMSKTPRMSLTLSVGLLLVLLLLLLAPQQVPVLFYKICALALGGGVGYYIVREVLPFARPSGYLAKPWRENTGSTLDAADFEVAPGCMVKFLCACAFQVLGVIGGMWAMAWAL